MSRAGRPLTFLVRLLSGWLLFRVTVLAGPGLWAYVRTMHRPRLAASGVDEARGRMLGARSPAVLPLAKSTNPEPADPPLAALASGVKHGTGFARMAGLGRSGGGALDALPGAPLDGRTGLEWRARMVDPMHDDGLAFTRPRAGLAGVVRAADSPGLISGQIGLEAAAPGLARRDRATAGRWSATGWLLWRPQSGRSLAQGPLLGGSQAGVRLDYRLSAQRAGPVYGLYGRFTRALTGPGAPEAALGFSLRPTARFPATLMVERRQRLGQGGRDGFALMVAGGVGPGQIAPRIELDGYGEGGVVALPGAAGFADGKATLGYRLIARGGANGVVLGASMSGSVQPGVHRIDLGPELRWRLPIGRGAMRLSAEWRQRVAGDARPSSGPAITVVTEF